MQKIIDFLFSQSLFYKIKLYLFTFLVKRSFNYKNRVAMYDKLARLTSDDLGLKLSDVFSILMEQQTSTTSFEIKIPKAISMFIGGKDRFTYKKTNKTMMYYGLEDMYERMKSGGSESEAMSRYLPQTDIMMIEAFVGDDMSEGFKNLIAYNKKTREMSSTLKKAVIAPVFYIVALYSIIGFFSISLVPEIVKTIPEGTKFSWGSELVIFFSDNYFSILIYTIVIVISLISILSYMLPRYNGSFRLMLEKIPPFSIYKIVNGCGFLNALNSLTMSGFQEFDAIERILDKSTENKNYYMEHRLRLIIEHMKNSESVGKALVSINLDFPDKEILKDLEIFSRFGVLDESLPKITEEITEKGLGIINLQAKIVNTVMIVIVVLGILMLFNGIFSLTTDLSNGISASSAM